MVVHLAALAPSLSSVSKFVATQLKNPAKRALGIDALSKALHRGTESFLAIFEAEYERRETLSTLLEGSTQDSVSAFLREPSTQELLTAPFTGDAGDASGLASLWNEIKMSNGKPLVDLPTTFDWNAVWVSYLNAVLTIKAETAELRDKWTAENLDQIKRATEGLRGVPPRFTVEKYREALVQEYGTLKLSAIHAEYNPASADKTVALQKIYVQQRVKEAFPPRDLSRDYRRRLEAESRLFGVSEDAERENLAMEYERVPAQPLRDVLLDAAAYQRIVILGDPGLGKSTLLQHLALDWVEGTSHTVPFLIELRKYTRDHSRPRSFLEFLESGTWSCCHLAQGELDQYLKGGDAMVLFDGLDEVFDASLRGNIVAEVINFARDYPNAKVIVTTRVVGYAIGSPNSEQFRAAGFRQFTLQDFNDEEIKLFTSKWYAASISDAAERSDLAARLNKDIAGSRSIRELAGNPLLLTMMALLNRRKQLPRERLKLYDACAELLVEGWDAARHLERSAYLTLDDKVEILQRIAYEMQHERQGLGGNMISENRVREILVQALSNLGIATPRIAAGRIAKALSERDFMLCSVGDDQFSFVHRTFLEYFCAKEFKSHIDDGNGPEELVDLFRTHWIDDAWHEVLRLLCAMVGPDLASRLIRELINARKLENEWQAWFLAADCLSEVRQVGKVQDELDTVQAQIEALTTYSRDRRFAAEVQEGAIDRLTRYWPGLDSTKHVLEAGLELQYWKPRFRAVEELVHQWNGETTRQWLIGVCGNPHSNPLKIQGAIHGLAVGWPDESVLLLLLELLKSQRPNFPFHTVVNEISLRWPEQTSMRWLKDTAVHHGHGSAREAAVREVARRWPEVNTKEWLVDLLSKTEDSEVAKAAASEIGRLWRDGETMDVLLKLARQRREQVIRDGIIYGLASSYQSESVRTLISDRISEADDPEGRATLISVLVMGWPDLVTRKKLVLMSTSEPNESVREAALSVLAETWPDEESEKIVRDVLMNAESRYERWLALVILVDNWPNDRTKQLMLVRSTQDADPLIQGGALDELHRRWPNEPVLPKRYG